MTAAALVIFNITRALGFLGPSAAAAILLILILLALAWSCGATRADLGLRLADVRSGLLYGLGAFGLVLAALSIAAAIPATNDFLHDSRAAISGDQLLHQIVVEIFLLTVIPEELAFRGILLGSAMRMWRPWMAALATSALFGLWHIAPTLRTLGDNSALSGASDSLGQEFLAVIGAVVATFVAGLVFCWLRLRPRSLVAPMLAHLATNGVALTVAWFVLH
jgi:membrane protease YdiL (CAAX protease family)